MTHPALHEPVDIATHERHFVPDGWDDLDRGICPCGELVRWTGTGWTVDRSLVAFVLTRDEATMMRWLVAHPDFSGRLQAQLELNQSPLECEVCGRSGGDVSEFIAAKRADGSPWSWCEDCFGASR